MVAGTDTLGEVVREHRAEEVLVAIPSADQELLNTVIMGAELNAKMEHQTAWDTTTGAPKPMGHRGALVADTVGPRKGAPGAVRYTLQYAEELSRRLMLKLGKKPEA